MTNDKRSAGSLSSVICHSPSSSEPVWDIQARLLSRTALGGRSSLPSLSLDAREHVLRRGRKTSPAGQVCQPAVNVQMVPELSGDDSRQP